MNKGKVHKYLGMTLDFTTKGQVKISMFDYVKEVIAAWDNAPQLNDGFVTVTAKRTKRVLRPKTFSKLMRMPQNLMLRRVRPSTTS